MTTKRMALQDQEEAVLVFGQHDKNLKELERRFGVQIFVRTSPKKEGLTLSIRGRSRSVEQALSTLSEMKRSVQISRQNNSEGDLVDVPLSGVPKNGKLSGDDLYITVTGRSIRPLSPQQKKYVNALRKSDLTFGVGAAGTGKTYLAVACAIAALETGKVSRIVLTRPVVEAGEKLGFLPGDFYEKVHPYLKPLYDAFYSMVGPDKFRLLKDEETIEIVPLAYMRGRTLDESFIILDEAQNTTPEQMKMFLTRMGNGSRVVVTGDVTQIDLENKSKSGLVQILNILKDVEGVSFIRFSAEDVMRHGMVKKIIQAYIDWGKKDGPSK